MTIYLLHFNEPLIGQRRNAHAQRTQIARHYIGYTGDLATRIEQHRAGHGARLLAVLAEAGIGFTVAATWPGDRTDERRLKRQHHAARFCPICRQSQNEVTTWQA
jgi:hypothetical protein